MDNWVQKMLKVLRHTSILVICSGYKHHVSQSCVCINQCVDSSLIVNEQRRMSLNWPVPVVALINHLCWFKEK